MLFRRQSFLVRFCLVVFGVLLAGAMPASPAFAQGQGRQAGTTLTLYSWSDYIDPALLIAFEAESGIRVVQDSYTKAEILEARLMAGGSGYDVAILPGAVLQRLIAAGRLRQLEKDRLANMNQLAPDLLRRLALEDPGNRHAVTYFWTAFGFGVNQTLLRQRLGEKQPLDSWDLLLKPELSNKIKSCGIVLLDSAPDLLPGLVKALGFDPNARRQDDTRKALDALFRIRAAISQFRAVDPATALADEKACLVVTSASDVAMALRQAMAQRQAPEAKISFLIPREGAPLAIDALAVPADAPNPLAAHRFIDFVLRPDNAARNAAFLAFASGNALNPNSVQKPAGEKNALYPAPAVMQRLFSLPGYDLKTAETLSRSWRRIVNGQKP
jgi:putrescine transport system substrate-binding protein